MVAPGAKVTMEDAMVWTISTEEYPTPPGERIMDNLVAKLECADCSVQWDTNYNKLNDNLNAYTECKNCGWHASAWNFIPKVKDK